MLYVSSQICHGRLIFFQPGADTDVWHDVFFVFVWACWRLVPHRSKLKNGNSCSWQQITFGTECWIFLWQDVGKESSLLTGLCIFFGEADGDGGVWACWRLVPHRSKLKNGKSWSWQQSRLEQNAGIFFVARCWERIQFFLTGLCFFFCEPDGDGGVWACWRLVPHRSKLQIGKSQCKLATNHVWNRMLDFFSWQEVGKESSLLTGLCIFVWWGWRWDPTDNLHVFFGFLWACWRWVPHRSQNQNWEETIFLKDRAQYCTMNIILHAHLHRTRTTHIIFKLVLQSR